MRVADGASSSGAEPAAPAAEQRQQSPVTSQPAATEQPRVGHHAQRVRRDRQLPGGAEHPGRHLSGGEQAESELADSPAEPDRRLTQADAADGDLADGDDADGDLTDGDDADGGRPPPAGRVDAANDVHERQPETFSRDRYSKLDGASRSAGSAGPPLSAPNQPAQP